MKQILSIIFILNLYILSGQGLSQSEFDKIKAESSEIIALIMANKYDILEEKLHLEEIENNQVLKSILSAENIKFNELNGDTYASPHFLLTEQDDKLDLVITALKILPERQGESFMRGKYYFVIQSKIAMTPDNTNVLISDSKLLTEESDIQKWFLSQYKGYVKETKKVFDLYSYRPPPPPLPPENLK